MSICFQNLEYKMLIGILIQEFAVGSFIYKVDVCDED